MQRIDVKLSKNKQTRKERFISDSLMKTDLFIKETVAGKEKPTKKLTYNRNNEALAGLFETVAGQLQKGYSVMHTEVFD
jgi:hypothetical protein